MSIFFTIALTYILLLIVSPTIRKESKGTWERLTGKTKDFAHWSRMQWLRFRQGRETKKQDRATKAASKAVNTQAIIELHIALTNDDPTTFQQVRKKYEHDKTIQGIADEMLHAHEAGKPGGVPAESDTGPSQQPRQQPAGDEAPVDDGGGSPAGADLSNPNGQNVGAEAEGDEAASETPAYVFAGHGSGDSGTEVNPLDLPDSPDTDTPEAVGIGSPVSDAELEKMKPSAETE